MATFLELKTDIATETDREALRDTTIANAVKAAIVKYEVERFWFNETNAYTLTLTPGQSSYVLSAGTMPELKEFITIDFIEASIGGRKRRLDRITRSQMAYETEVAHSGQPLDWSQTNDTIRIYPTPNIAYVITVTGHYRFQELVDGSSNVWTTHAYDLIKNEAKFQLYMTIREFDVASMFQGMAAQAYRTLQLQTSRRLSNDTVKGWPYC